MMIGLALAVLVLIAHPDDESLFAGLLHALTHRLNATVDLACVTNGEGGFRHSAPSESLYGRLPLSNETVGRQQLPRIRKQELLDSGKVLGIRKYFFYEQFDLKYDRNPDVVLAEQWDKEWVIRLLQKTIGTGNGEHGYDLMVIMLPNNQSHGHHTASGLLALETIRRLHEDKSATIKIPTVIGGSEFVLTERPTYPWHRLAHTSTEFRFNRRWKLSRSSAVPDYNMIVLWVCSAHKSQGGLIAETLTTLWREHEQYFYFSLNQHVERFHLIETLFERLVDAHDYDSGNVL